MKRKEVVFKPLVQKWRERSNDITLMYMSIIILTCHRVEKVFDLLNKLQDFDDKQDSFLRRLTICFSKYLTEKFDLFPCALKSIHRIKEKEESKKELDDIFYGRLNKIINEKGYLLWAIKNEEMAKAQIFYNDIRKDLVDLEAMENSLIAVHREVLNFDWPDDTIFGEWKDKIMHLEQLVGGDEEEDSTKIIVTLIADEKDKEDPQVGVSMQEIEDDSSLTNLKATYVDDLE